jgi:hypothetical protein
MGRWYYNKKATVEEALDLTVFQLKAYDMLKAGYNTSRVITWVQNNTGKESSVNVEVNMIDDPYVKISYSISDRQGNSKPYDSEISLVTTPCNLGGIRYWFGCPYCGEHVGGIYLAPGDSYFMCRHCCNLTYRSRNRCSMEALGHTSRQIKKLRSEIKRWTWRCRPTRKVKKLNRLERKCNVLAGYAQQVLMKLKTRFNS